MSSTGCSIGFVVRDVQQGKRSWSRVRARCPRRRHFMLDSKCTLPSVRQRKSGSRCRLNVRFMERSQVPLMALPGSCLEARSSLGSRRSKCREGGRRRSFFRAGRSGAEACSCGVAHWQFVAHSPRKSRHVPIPMRAERDVGSLG